MAGLEPFGVIANEKAKNPHGDYKLIDTQAITERLAAVDPFLAPELEAATRAFVEERELKMKHIGQPTRVALTGGTVSPPIFDCMEIYGRDVTLARLRAAAESA